VERSTGSAAVVGTRQDAATAAAVEADRAVRVAERVSLRRIVMRR
jgi:hypothetical protein